MSPILLTRSAYKESTGTLTDVRPFVAGKYMNLLLSSSNSNFYLLVDPVSEVLHELGDMNLLLILMLVYVLGLPLFISLVDILWLLLGVLPRVVFYLVLDFKGSKVEKEGLLQHLGD